MQNALKIDKNLLSVPLIPEDYVKSELVTCSFAVYPVITMR